MAQESNKTTQGLQIDKKTIFTVTGLLVLIMIFAGILTQVIPAGEYNVDAEGAIINGTYHTVESDYQFCRVFISPVEALVRDTSSALTGVAIILFIILIGGTFLVLDRSGVLKYIMVTIVGKFGNKKYTLLPLIVLVCMAMSSFVGILEESITLVPLAVAISLALGWDSLVGLSFSLVSIAFGYAAATFNPFNVVVVQSMSDDLTLFSGTLYRVLVFAVVYLVFLAFLIPYAKRIEKDPKKSVVYENDIALRERFLGEQDGIAGNKTLGKATRTFLLCISGVVVATVLTFVVRNFIENDAVADIISYIPMVAMAILFTVGGIRAGHIAGIRGKALAHGFWEGAKAILPCAPLILLVVSITYILKAGKVIGTILNYVYGLIDNMSPFVAILVIFLLVLVLEFFIGSGTAKAFLIMPLMLPLASMCGISHQSITLAFCLSDGFGNILFPTSGIMLVAIGIINLSYGKYMKFMWKIFAAEFAASAALMLLAIAIGY